MLFAGKKRVPRLTDRRKKASASQPCDGGRLLACLRKGRRPEEQDLVEPPNPVCQAQSHCRRALRQGTGRQTEIVVRHCQMSLLFQALRRVSQGIDPASQSGDMLAQRQIMPLDKSGVDLPAVRGQESASETRRPPVWKRKQSGAGGAF